MAELKTESARAHDLGFRLGEPGSWEALATGLLAAVEEIRDEQVELMRRLQVEAEEDRAELGAAGITPADVLEAVGPGKEILSVDVTTGDEGSPSVILTAEILYPEGNPQAGIIEVSGVEARTRHVVVFGRAHPQLSECRTTVLLPFDLVPPRLDS